MKESDPYGKGTRCRIVSPSLLRGKERTMKKKTSLPLAAPRHRMVLAADVWLKKAEKKKGEK